MTAKIKLNAASGGGSFSLQAPSSSSNNRVLTLPDAADGIVAQTDSSGNFSVSGTTTCTGNVTCSNDLSVDNDLKADSGFGSTTTIYGVRAWATIDGTGTVSNRASGNVSSTTDNGTGDYTVNFTTNFPDVNYSVACAIPVINDQGATYGWGLKHDNGGASSAPTTKTTSACRFQARRESDFDIDFGHVMFVR